MSVRKSDEFIADVERQFEWYAVNANWDLAERSLRDWRFFVVFRPFKKHILFYEVTGDDVILRRALHGYRDLPRRLLEPPGAS